MKVFYTEQAKSDLKHWIKYDQKIYKKAHKLIRECQTNPFTGTGKPEPLKHMHPYWSRRLSQKHRLVYYVEGSGANKVLTVISAKEHY